MLLIIFQMQMYNFLIYQVANTYFHKKKNLMWKKMGQPNLFSRSLPQFTKM